MIPPFPGPMIWSVEPARLLLSPLSSAKPIALWPSLQSCIVFASPPFLDTELSWPESCAKVGLLSFPLFNWLESVDLLPSEPPWAYLFVKDEDIPGSMPMTIMTVPSMVVRTMILLMLFWTSVASKMMRVMVTIIATNAML